MILRVQHWDLYRHYGMCMIVRASWDLYRPYGMCVIVRATFFFLFFSFLDTMLPFVYFTYEYEE